MRLKLLHTFRLMSQDLFGRVRPALLDLREHPPDNLFGHLARHKTVESLRMGVAELGQDIVGDQLGEAIGLLSLRKLVKRTVPFRLF
jgi:hypothetical protein